MVSQGQSGLGGLDFAAKENVTCRDRLAIISAIGCVSPAVEGGILLPGPSSGFRISHGYSNGSRAGEARLYGRPATLKSNGRMPVLRRVVTYEIANARCSMLNPQ